MPKILEGDQFTAMCPGYAFINFEIKEINGQRMIVLTTPELLHRLRDQGRATGFLLSGVTVHTANGVRSALLDFLKIQCGHACGARDGNGSCPVTSR